MNSYLYLVGTPGGIELVEVSSKSRLFAAFTHRQLQVLAGPFDAKEKAEAAFPEAQRRQRLWAPAVTADNGPEAVEYVRAIQVEPVETEMPLIDSDGFGEFTGTGEF